MAQHPVISPDPRTLAVRVAQRALRVANGLSTNRPGTLYIPNGDGSGTIIGPGAGSDGTGTAQGVVPWVGDTTPPGRPTGVTATSAWGIVYVTWDGTLEGGVPADFSHVSVLVDGSEVAQMARQGTVAVEGLAAGATVTVTLVAYDDAHARDGSSAPNASEPSEPVTVVVSDERAEIDQAVSDAENAANKAEQAADEMAGQIEDVNVKIEGLQGDLDHVSTQVTGAVENASAALEASSQAVQDVNGFKLTVSQTYATKDELGKETLDRESAITQSAESILAQVSENYVDKETGATLATKTEVEQSAEGIRQEVSETYLTSADAAQSYAAKSYVDQAADSIRSEVASDYQSKDGMSSYYTKTEVDQKNDAITSTVSTAQSTADSALSKASTVEQTAEGLTVRLDGAEEDIGLAQTAASNAQSSADAAKTEAQTAQALANTAKTAAETAQGTATSALGTANRAQSAASAAQGAADDAAKVATNFLGFSSEGLVIGDQTGSSLGKNALIDSGSLSIRDGSTVLASFEDDSISLADGNERAGIYLCGRRAQLTYVAGNGMNLRGTGLNVDGALYADMLASRGTLNVSAPMYLGDGRRTGIRCFVQGTVVVTISDSTGTLFTSSQYQSLVGRAYKSGDVVLVCNGDRNANTLGPIASCNPSSGYWYVNVPTAASGSASYRVNYLIVAVY